MNLSREHFRAMIFYDFKSSLTPKECIERLRSAFGDKAPSQSTVYEWYAEFKRGRTTLSDEPKEGRPVTAVTPPNINAVRKLLEEDRRTTYSEIETSLGIGGNAIKIILHDHIGVRKLCARWIPHNLTESQKKARVDWCRKNIERFDRGQSNHVYDIVTGDETWIYCYEPESKQQSAQWVFPDEDKPTKVKRGRSASKQMVASFFGRTGHVATVALPPDSTVNAEWYTTQCLRAVLIKVREKRPKGGIILHHDNARPHIANRTTEYLKANGVEILHSPSNSPDLAPCDFFLFPTIKNKMRGLQYNSPEEAIEAYEKNVSEVTPEQWAQCFKDWFLRMQKCIDCNGEYFEKQ